MVSTDNSIATCLVNNMAREIQSEWTAPKPQSMARWVLMTVSQAEGWEVSGDSAELRLETGTARVWGQPKPCQGTVQRSFRLESNTFRSVLYKDHEQQCTNRQERNEAWKLASQLEDCCGSNSRQEITAALAKRERGLQQACRLNKWVPFEDGEWKGMESWRRTLDDSGFLPLATLWRHPWRRGTQEKWQMKEKEQVHCYRSPSWGQGAKGSQEERPSCQATDLERWETGETGELDYP